MSSSDMQACCDAIDVSGRTVVSRGIMSLLPSVANVPILDACATRRPSTDRWPRAEAIVGSPMLSAGNDQHRRCCWGFA